ncbi:MAG: pyridoxal phosphate-dependent aminotransferase [Alphaproteobacteria bacterium]|nr:pyridoxal phosphate-dependent aminotransferase [Alphaproteobacteria bacterium]
MNRFPENDIIELVGAPPRYDLGESTGPDLRLADLLDGEALGGLPLGYGSAAGDPELCAAIAADHGAAPDDVVVTAGGMHALFLLAFVLCKRGDEAVIVTPCFPLARNALAAVGADLRVLRLSFDQGYRLDPYDLRAALSPRTRLISLASPQNPSGVAISHAALRESVQLMQEICPDAYLLVDETYRAAAYADELIAETALALSPKVVSVASLSKCHGAPGLRIGWAITADAALRRQMVVAKFNTIVSCPRVDEALALKLFERRAPILAERRVLLDEGLQRTAAWVRTNSDYVEWVRPDAGAICCVRLRRALFDDEGVNRFHQTAAAKGARVAKGDWFGEEARVLRVGFGLPSIAELGDALEALTEALKETATAGGRL